MQIIKQMDNGTLKTSQGDFIASNIVADRLGTKHKNLLRNITKIKKMEKSIGSELSPLKVDFNPVFKEYFYIDGRNREQRCTLMNKDAVFALIKTVNTQEAYEYYREIVSEFKHLREERRKRALYKPLTRKYTDTLKLLYGKLKEEGTGQPESGFYATVQRKVYKSVTGEKLPTGGIDHDVLSEDDNSRLAGAKTLVGRFITEELNSGEKTAREIRQSLYKILEGGIRVGGTE